MIEIIISTNTVPAERTTGVVNNRALIILEALSNKGGFKRFDIDIVDDKVHKKETPYVIIQFLNKHIWTNVPLPETLLC